MKSGVSPVAAIKPPQLPKPLPVKTFTQLEAHMEYSAGAFSNIDLSEQTAAEVLFEQAALQRIIFLRTHLARPRLFDVRAKDCDFSGAEWEKARFRRVELTACRLLGVQFLEAQFDQVVFKDCNLEGAVFIAAALKLVRFENCNLRAISCEQADCTGAVFHHCDLTGANFSGARLAGADLRGSQLSGLIIAANDIQGAVIETHQAAQIVALLGVNVNDEPF